MLTYLTDHSYILVYLYKIGPFFLFFALILGIIGLPLPDELLLIGAGYLVSQHKLNSITTFAAALFGSLCGITLSYLFGRYIGGYIIKKYGKALRITPEKIALTKHWYSRMGKWILMIGYFIPLFRHLFGFVAGGAKMRYPQFALFAYSGALLWCITFLLIGYFFPDYVLKLFRK